MPQPKIHPIDLYTTNNTTVNGDKSKLLVDEFQAFAQVVASPGPATFRQDSVSGFVAGNSTDFPGIAYTGLTITGGPSGVRSVQFAVNYDMEELAPTLFYFRVNDDTGTPSAWGPWSQIHVGTITFTTATTAPTGGRPGDIQYSY